MDIKKLSNDELHQSTMALVREERLLTTQVLLHLSEISVRRLFAIRGYSSLWEYCVKGLKYSEASAQRRISAMKLMTDVPEVEQLINEGKISLSTASQVQSVCRGKPALRREVLASVMGKSKRQTERILAAVVPQEPLPERRRQLNAQQTEVRFVVSEELDRKLERIKELTASKNFNPTYAELFEMMADMVLGKIDSNKGRHEPPPAEVKARPIVAPSRRQPSRYIRKRNIRMLRARAESCCEYVDKVDGRRCEERRCLEIHHVKPFARGGSNELQNLMLLCPAHNKLQAIQDFGARKMERYLRKT